MKGFVLSAALAVALGAGLIVYAEDKPAADKPAAAASAADGKPINKKCPVQGDDVDPKITTVYQGKTIGFCCRDCVDDFKKDPEKYMAKVNYDLERAKEKGQTK